MTRVPAKVGDIADKDEKTQTHNHGQKRLDHAFLLRLDHDGSTQEQDQRGKYPGNQQSAMEVTDLFSGTFLVNPPDRSQFGFVFNHLPFATEVADPDDISAEQDQR